MTPTTTGERTPAVSGVGVASMVTPLRRVALRRPGAILTADPGEWHYAAPIDATTLAAEHDAFVDTLRRHGAVVEWLDEDGGIDAGDGLADSIFTFDPSFVLPDGAILLRPGKSLRRAEVDLHRRFYERVGIEILGEIAAPGTVEGGDCCWLDDRTLAVGRGYRTDQPGIDQLAAICADHGVTVEVYDLPHLHGPDACLHLLSILNPLDVDLALVRLPLLPVALVQRLRALGYELLDVPADEFEASNGLCLNVLATAPRRAVAIDGFPETLRLMRAAGCDVDVVAAGQLCLPTEGGPTCLTRPLLRG